MTVNDSGDGTRKYKREYLLVARFILKKVGGQFELQTICSIM